MRYTVEGERRDVDGVTPLRPQHRRCSATGSRDAANAIALSYLQNGYWVQVYDGETGSRLAGPLDPAQPVAGDVLS